MAHHQSQDTGMARERAVRGFRNTLRSQLSLAKKRGAAIQRQMDEFVALKAKQHRDGVMIERALCEVGREIVLNPDWARTESDVVVSPDSRPPGLDWFLAQRSRRLLNREVRALELCGVLDPGIGRKLDSIVGHIQKLADAGHDVSAMTGVDAYATSLHIYWSQRKYPVERFLNELDPDADRPGDATAVMFLYGALGEDLNAPSTVIRTREEWADLGIRVLFALDPEFDGSQIGLRETLPWREGAFEESAMRDRKWLSYLLRLHGGPSGVLDPLTALLTRATEFLGDAVRPDIVQQFSIPESPTVTAEEPTMVVADVPRPAWMDVPCTGLPLRGWTAILKAMGKPYSRQLKDRMRNLNERFGGPITTVNNRPEVYEERFLAWLAFLAEQRNGLQASRAEEDGQPVVDYMQQALQEKHGFTMRYLSMHTETRPNGRGKARPARDCEEAEDDSGEDSTELD